MMARGVKICDISVRIFLEHARDSERGPEGFTFLDEVL